eukprot:TRINITY_DN356_c3_g1_i1.p1 TRINITY_DN356_c3_g1~~TRINITY_DN356_c3_g1_i1.p1  ORF type:complete len:356 (-),score=63.82 TRINITY_DN356_c3_g1_i1:94-1161(-)
MLTSGRVSAILLSIYSASASRASLCDDMCRTPSDKCEFYPSLSYQGPALEELFCQQACQISGDRCVQGSGTVGGVCEEVCKPWNYPTPTCVFYPPKSLSPHKADELYCKQFCCNGDNGNRNFDSDNTDENNQDNLQEDSSKYGGKRVPVIQVDDYDVPETPAGKIEAPIPVEDGEEEVLQQKEAGKGSEDQQLEAGKVSEDQQLEECYNTRASPKGVWNIFLHAFVKKPSSHSRCPKTEYGTDMSVYMKAVEACSHLYENAKCRQRAGGGMEMRRQVAIRGLRDLDTSLELPYPYTCEVATLCMKEESSTVNKLVKVKKGQNQDINRSLCLRLEDGSWDSQILTCIPKVVGRKPR